MKKREDLKILYVQIRKDQPTREQELDEFVRFSGLREDQFTVINVFDTPHFEPSVVDGHDAFVTGGSSDTTGLKTKNNPDEYPYGQSFYNLTNYCIEHSIPTFASCQGFEDVVVAVGGELVVDERNVGKGFAHIQLTEEGKRDALFHDIENGFPAVSWHSERAEKMPENFIVLAERDTCPYDAAKIKGKPFYAFQFHPEIDRKGLIDRLELYITRYRSEEAEQLLAAVKKDCPEVAESNGLVRKFVDRIVLGM